MCSNFSGRKRFVLILSFVIVPIILNLNSIADAWSMRSIYYPNSYLTGENMDNAWGGLAEIFIKSHFWKAIFPLFLLILIGQYKQKMKIIGAIVICMFFYIFLVILVGEPGRTWELPLMRYSSTILFITLVISNMLSFTKMNAVRTYFIGSIFLFFLISLGISVTQSYAHSVAPDFGIPKASKEIINFINTEIDPSERILIEDSGWQEGHQYDNMHFVSILPYFVSSEIIGGPHPCSISKYTSNRFVGGRLSGKPMNGYTRHMIDQYIDYYDIQWVISYSQEAKDFFRQYEDLFKKVRKIAQFSIYRVARKITTHPN